MITFSPLLYALVAVIYLALAGWRVSIGGGRRASAFLAIGFAGMALWGACSVGGDLRWSIAGESLRNAAWCLYLALIIRQDRSLATQTWIVHLPSWLAALALVRAAACAWLPIGSGEAWALLFVVSALALCIGALVLLHSLIFAADHAASGFRLLLFALAALWAYDLNAYAALLLRFDVSELLTGGRALLALLLAPLFGIAARRKVHWSFSPSRAITFQSLSIIAIGSYFVLLSTIAGMRPWLGAPMEMVAGTALVTAAFAVIVAMAVSDRARAVVRVFLSKHLFKHRYDYRVEWLRFNATINSGSLTGLSPEQRAIKALADIMDATGGVLFLSAERGRLEHAADLDWPRRPLLDQQVAWSEDPGDVPETDARIMISPHYRDGSDATPFPVGLPTDGSVWLAVPLVRIGSLVGLVALGRPRVARRLDWEDFDLLKVLGQQIATYIADARRQAELEEARQFEEFNRRFAFIVHDIKNVVSQLSLVAANAEEHGANPRFQADMASTLRNAVGKMTTLLSRLSHDASSTNTPLTDFDAGALLERIASNRRSQHPVVVTAPGPVPVLGDPARLDTAIDHLVQNAIEASVPGEQVVLSAHVRDGQGVISVLDSGTGMSGDFIRRQLFKPFASTKAAGFGIGAGEARALVRQMGGDLEVQSVEGVGTSFIIRLALGTALGETQR